GLLQGLEGAPTLGEIRDEAEDPAGPALLVLEARERQGDDQLGAIGEKQAALVGPRLPRVEDPHEQLLGPSGGAGRDDLVELPPQEELPRAAQRATQLVVNPTKAPVDGELADPGPRQRVPLIDVARGAPLGTHALT